jgi:hypothetical protein
MGAQGIPTGLAANSLLKITKSNPKNEYSKKLQIDIQKYLLHDVRTVDSNPLKHKDYTQIKNSQLSVVLGLQSNAEFSTERSPQTTVKRRILN